MPYKDRERAAEQRKQWLEQNKERRAEQQKRWLEQNKERAAEKNKLWREQNKERVAEQKKQRYEQNKEQVAEKARIYGRIQRYNLTPEDMAVLLLNQNNSCFICQTSFNQKKMNVDHCHNTGKIRKLLCHGCNTGLGHIEKPGFLQKALEYIESHREQHLKEQLGDLY